MNTRGASTSTDPLDLLIILCVGHVLTHPLRIVESPHRQLYKHSELREDIEVVKLLRLLLFTEWVSLWCFCQILPPGVLVEYFSTTSPVRCDFPYRYEVSAYVIPRCDETCFSRQRPISLSFSDGPGLRHSCSRSYMHRSAQATTVIHR